ncbi:hypothetical protein KLP40_01635 [Hymenobacter sp. NST-14]|uniref:hypothetical protein n=1 Tax=Hymenobacter piscis TaxID=2839984 RepID=UPI001C02EBFC|nr:hypothetical protein [Hymenobacter piscis]MBT9391850.1 hypothetical protein [Hymenobacter piscis]
MPARSRVLVTELDFSPDVVSTVYYERVQREFAAQGVPVAYAPEQEWELKAHGIRHPLDSLQIGALRQLGYTHVLVVRSAGQQYGAADYFFPWQVAQGALPYDGRIQSAMANAGSKSRVSFTLISLTEERPVYLGMTTSSVGSLAVQDRRGGITQTNLAATEYATHKALRKGTRRLLSRSRRVP